MDILRDSQLVIFSHSTIFIKFSYKSLAGFLLNSCKVRGDEYRKWRWIFAFDRCVPQGRALFRERALLRDRALISFFKSANVKWFALP